MHKYEYGYMQKLAALNKLATLYTAMKGILRIKQAGGVANRLNKAVRAEPGGVEWVREFNSTIKNNPIELRQLYNAVINGDPSFSPAQVAIIKHYGAQLPQQSTKATSAPFFSQEQVAAAEADSARRIRNMKANQKPVFDPTKFTMQPDPKVRKELRRNVRQVLKEYPAGALTMDPRQLNTPSDLAAKMHAFNAVEETANKPSSITSTSSGGTSKSSTGGKKPAASQKAWYNNKYVLPAALGLTALGAGTYYLNSRNKRKDITPYIRNNDLQTFNDNIY